MLAPRIFTLAALLLSVASAAPMDKRQFGGSMGAASGGIRGGASTSGSTSSSGGNRGTINNSGQMAESQTTNEDFEWPPKGIEGLADPPTAAASTSESPSASPTAEAKPNKRQFGVGAGSAVVPNTPVESTDTSTSTGSNGDAFVEGVDVASLEASTSPDKRQSDTTAVEFTA